MSAFSNWRNTTRSSHLPCMHARSSVHKHNQTHDHRCYLACLPIFTTSLKDKERKYYLFRHRSVHSLSSSFPSTSLTMSSLGTMAACFTAGLKNRMRQRNNSVQKMVRRSPSLGQTRREQTHTSAMRKVKSDRCILEIAILLAKLFCPLYAVSAE